jgi:acetyl-CoA carboxylase biotin carboxyl carrier protein
MADVTAPMAGSIKEILVSVGDSVDAEQEIIILESMKMEVPLEAPSAGTVREILVAVGQAVSEGQKVVVLG